MISTASLFNPIWSKSATISTDPWPQRARGLRHVWAMVPRCFTGRFIPWSTSWIFGVASKGHSDFGTPNWKHWRFRRWILAIRQTNIFRHRSARSQSLSSLFGGRFNCSALEQLGFQWFNCSVGFNHHLCGSTNALHFPCWSAKVFRSFKPQTLRFTSFQPLIIRIDRDANSAIGAE